MINSKTILGNGVKRLRESKGLSQDAFSELIGVTMQTISQIECAKKFSTSETIDKICNTYNITPDVLFAKNPAYFTEDTNTREEEILNIVTMLNGLEIDKIKIVKELIKVFYTDSIEIKFKD